MHKISMEDGKLLVDREIVTEEQLHFMASSWEEYIFVDYIYQAEYSNRIYSETVNSIRIVTAVRKNGDYEVVLAFHRFGTDFSRPVDNICSGGVVALVDIEKGALSVAKRVTEPDKCYANHPDSQSPIEGIIIPNWEKVKGKVLHVHKCFPYYKFLAWDVVIDEFGEPIVLEINRGSDLNVQVIRPLRKEKIGDFMREYGLLDMR